MMQGMTLEVFGVPLIELQITLHFMEQEIVQVRHVVTPAED